MTRLTLLPALAFLLHGFVLPAKAEEKLPPVRERYTKYEFMIPMRDGVKLYTAVYQPKDASRKYPFLLLRTPYSCRPYGADQFRETLGPSEFTDKAGYIFVYQDVRGRYKSEGTFEQVRPYRPNKQAKETDESSDTFDTLEWLVKNVPNHNGRAGMYGISYPGFYTSMGMLDAHPSLKAVSPQAPVGDWFLGDDWRHNGAFFLAHAVRWMFMNSREGATTDPNAPRRNPEYSTPDGYRLFLKLGTLEEINEQILKNSVPYWRDLVDHSTYDSFWKARDVRPYLTGVKPAVLTVGGWFDAEDLFGTLETYKRTEKQNPGIVNRIVMGPWYHGQWAAGTGDKLGDIRFDQNTGPWYREKVEFAFFEQHLKDVAEKNPAEATMFETGANQWRTFDAWPPKETTVKTLHLQPEGRLGWNPPSRSGFEEYVSDPAHPVPSSPYPANTMTVEYMLDDQRHASTRPDVLVFETPVLEEDLTVAGPLEVTLNVSTTGTDSDFVVKFIDVYPDDFPNPDPNPKNLKMGGYQQLVRGEPFRGKFRKSFEKPEPFVPGQMEKISFQMPDVFHSFRRGHRVMVQIQSTWFPLVDRNPQKFLDIAKAKRSDFEKAVQRVYYGTVAGSSIGLRVLPR